MGIWSVLGLDLKSFIVINNNDNSKDDVYDKTIWLIPSKLFGFLLSSALPVS